MHRTHSHSHEPSIPTMQLDMVHIGGTACRRADDPAATSMKRRAERVRSSFLIEVSLSIRFIFLDSTKFL